MIDWLIHEDKVWADLRHWYGMTVENQAHVHPGRVTALTG